MIYIVILNWNGWRDTLSCLQSLITLKNVDYNIIICDNGSTDNSVDYIKSWSQGMLAADVPSHPQLSSLVCNKNTPVSTHEIQILNRNEITLHTTPPCHSSITLIKNNANLGFAAGNNVGIEYALQQQDMTHVWLLNNDTLVEPDCLEKMLKRMALENSPTICGSRVMFYDDPNIVQALGGNQFNKWTGIAKPSIGRFSHKKDCRETQKIEATIDYISGCSMLVTRDFLEDIGLMEESYFLYYEEIDWAVRAKGKYSNIYADDAVIYHKEGSSIGSASLHTKPSVTSEFYKFRSKLMFTAKHFPMCLPSCYVVTLLQVFNRWLRNEWATGWTIFKILMGQRSL